MSCVSARNLQIGDLIKSDTNKVSTVTDIAPAGTDDYVKVWTDNQFVPKYYRPMDGVEVL